MVTPGMRCRTSVTDLSGSLPMSSATTESMISSAVRFRAAADSSAARWPTTTTVVASSFFTASAAYAPCANMAPLAISTNCAAPVAMAVL